MRSGWAARRTVIATVHRGVTLTTILPLVTRMTTAQKTAHPQSSLAQHWSIATVTYAIVAGVVTTALTTVIGRSLPGFTAVETVALASGSTGVVAAICWYYYLDRQSPSNVRQTAESVGVVIGVLVPFAVWIGFTAVTLPNQLVSSPGIVAGMGLVIIFHTVWLTLPLSFVVGFVLGRIYD